MTTLSTPRLSLEPIVPADLGDLHALNSEPDAMRFLGGVRTRDESAAELGRILAADAHEGFCGWAVRRRVDGAFLGRCGVKRSLEGGEHELLYAFRVEHWGCGYASEAAAAVLRHTFSLGVPRVIACVSSANAASLGVVRRIGMVFEREARVHDELVEIHVASQ
jgi:[ribosomal protein S5]-alanine N-acetyltransferase